MKYEQFLNMLSQHGCLQEYSESLPNEVKTQVLLALDGDWHNASKHAEELFEKQRAARTFIQQEIQKGQVLLAYASEMGYHTEELPAGQMEADEFQGIPHID